MSSFVKKSIITTTGSFICLILGVLRQMILSRHLGPDGMGQYDVVLQSGVLLSVISGLGLGQAGVYFINKLKIPAHKIVMNALYWILISGIISIMVLIVIISLNVDYFGKISILTVFIFSTGAGSVLFVNMLRPVLIAELKASQAVIVSSMLPFASLCFIIIASLFGFLQTEMALIAMALGNIISALIVLFFVRQDISFKFGFDFKLFYKVFIYGLKLFASNLVLVANTSVSLLYLRYLLPNNFTQIGYFGRAIALCGISKLFLSSITPLLYSKWSQHLAHDLRARQVEQVLRVSFALGVLIILFFLLFGKYVIILLYGHEFIASAQPMYILVFAIVLNSLVNIYSYVYAGDGKPLTNTLLFGISIPIILSAMYFLVPNYGIIGAAWSFLIASIIAFLLAAILTHKIYGVCLQRSILITKKDLIYISQSVFKKS